jgi:hypothetical protein
MRRFAGIALAVLLAAAPVVRADEEGFKPLFNGKDLAGWVNVNTGPGTFFVKDNMIITTGKPTGFLRTERMYENFILELEWMHVNTKEVGNSGLFVWGDPLPAVGSPYTRGIEVQVLVNLEWKDKATGGVTASSHGDVFSIWGATCKPDRPHPLKWERCIPSEFRAKGGGEWNHYRIEANDGVIKLAVNGKVVSGVSACNPRKGYLALESEGAECRFRNIKIKELPSSQPKPEEIATEAKDHKNLLVGDLTGWKVDEAAKKHWQPRDWMLTYDGKSEAKPPYLNSEAQYGDFELTFDWRLPSGKPKPGEVGGVSVSFRNDGKWLGAMGINQAGAISVSVILPEKDQFLPIFGENKAVADIVRPAGQWNRAVVTMRGQRLTVALNGKVVVDNVDTQRVAPRGGIAIGSSRGPIDIANVFVREVK